MHLGGVKWYIDMRLKKEFLRNLIDKTYLNL
jgi:hypothetical protein